MLAVLTTLAPDFMLLMAGAVLGRFLPAVVWRNADRVNFRVMFPALIFLAAYSHPPAPGDLTVIALGTAFVMGAGCFLTWWLRPLGPPRFVDFAALWQTAWRFNTALGLVAVQLLPKTSHGLMSLAVAFAIPVSNLMAITALTHGRKIGVTGMLRNVVGNPFIVAGILGLMLPAIQIELPQILLGGLGVLSWGAVPVALLSIGAAVNWRVLAELDAFAGALNVVKLVILPVLVWCSGSFAGMSPDHLSVLTLFAALPTAPASLVLATVYGAERTSVATMVAQSTILGCVTLPLWLVVLT